MMPRASNLKAHSTHGALRLGGAARHSDSESGACAMFRVAFRRGPGWLSPSPPRSPGGLPTAGWPLGMGPSFH